MNWTIKRKLLGLATVSAILALALGATGYWGVRHIKSMTDRMDVNFDSIRNHMDADQMHDALHADVLGALLAYRDAGTEAASTAANLERHAQQFRKALDTLDRLDLPATVKRAVSDIRP